MIIDDPILELLLADSDRYDYAEERRLFYVALTRTKNRVFLITGSKYGRIGASVFIPELYNDSAARSIELFSLDDRPASIKCPRCGGMLIRKRGKDGNEFLGCSNYPYCDKTYDDVRILEDKKRCPDCGGWLIRKIRESDGKEFFGCTNYPKYCNYTMDLDGSNERPSTLPQLPGAQCRVPRCPKCGAVMELYHGRRTDFYVCPHGPACTGTVFFLDFGEAKPGDYVMHRYFGRGRITRVERDVAWVRFDHFQNEKCILLGHAPMWKIDW